MLCERAALAQIARAWSRIGDELNATCERCFQPTFTRAHDNARVAICPLCRADRPGREWRRVRAYVTHMLRARGAGDAA